MLAGRSLSTKRRAPVTFILFGALAVAMSAACRSSDKNETPRGLVVINSTASGVVRRVLVGEGARVNEGAVIIEIAPQSESSTARPEPDNAAGRARAAAVGAQQEIAAAQDEAHRAAVEVQRVEPLVASGAASQAQLDAARAQYQQAQERLQRAKERAQSAQRDLSIQQGRGPSQPQPNAPGEKLISVRASSSGTIRVISVRAGQRVESGQAIATLSSDN
jgi:HlyD family secretion protein